MNAIIDLEFTRVLRIWLSYTKYSNEVSNTLEMERYYDADILVFY